MQTSALGVRESLVNVNVPADIVASGGSDTSAVSWAAVFAGAAGAAALTLLLSMLGFGLGLSAISPWSDRGADGGTVGVISIAWVAFTQILSAIVGGYLAGRLRVKWMDAQADEIYFRDTAHGFLSWVVATLATVTLLGSVSAAVLSGGVQAVGAVATGAGAVAGGALTNSVANSSASSASVSPAEGGANSGAANMSSTANPLQYFADVLFRSESPRAEPGAVDQPAARTGAMSAAAAQTGSPSAVQSGVNRPDAAAEAVRIFAHDLRTGALSNEDREYLGRLISRQTGIGQAEAEKRATDTFYQLTTSIAKAEMTAKDAADKARKAAAHTSLWMFVALLAGAFCASLSATFGGRLRDEI